MELDEEEFACTDQRPLCPLCNEPMVHVETRVKFDPDHLHAWICSCEPQPEPLNDLIDEVREDPSPYTALIFAWLPEHPRHMKVCLDE